MLWSKLMKVSRKYLQNFGFIWVYFVVRNFKPLLSTAPHPIGEPLRGLSELILRTQSTGVFFTALHTDNGHAKHKTKVERNAPDRGGVYCPPDC